MNLSIKKLFHHYLLQLQVIVSKIPPEKFSLALSEGMFSLEMNAKIAANFALRGYCPLLNLDVVSFTTDDSGKEAVQQQLSKTLTYLADLPEIDELDNKAMVREKAGFLEVELSQPLFIHQFILPNFFFHISMVYATAKANGVDLSKGDFDGIHTYPKGFSFIPSP